MRIITKNMLLLYMLSLIAIIGACKRNIDGFVEDPSTSRAFIPANLKVRTVQDSAIVSWNLGALASGKKYTYKVEFATDTLFKNIEYTQTTDTLAVKLVDPVLTVNKTYFARVRVEPFQSAAASRWVNSSSFRISGQQFLKIIRDFEITETSVKLHWQVNAATTGINKIALINGSVTTIIDITAAEAQAGEKNLNGLIPDTRYTVQLIADKKSKGLASFSTLKTPVYTKTLSPSDNLESAITSAADGEVIGLNPGLYTISSFLSIAGKGITLRSITNNPANTKIRFRELSLVGDSAGVNLIGLDIDGNYGGASNSGAFLHLKGAGANGNAAAFKSIRVENCWIHNYTRALMLGNYGPSVSGSTPNAHVLKNFNIINSKIYDINPTGIDSYYVLSLERLQVINLNISKSTFYNLGCGLINLSWTLTGVELPIVTIDYCTFNNIGSQNKYLLVEAANRITFNLRNSILANSPLQGQTINNVAFKAGASSVLNFSNSNFFKLNTASGGTKLSLTGLAQSSNYEIDLGWSGSTTDFSLVSLPPNSPLHKASTASNTVGDPRWAY